MKRAIFRAIVRFLGWALLFTLELSAQQLAVLNVTATDPSGSVISRARISLRNLETDAERTDFASETGVAIIPGLPPGQYQLKVESDQFRSYRAKVSLAVGQNASVLVALGIKTVRENIDVQETIPGVGFAEIGGQSGH